MDTKIKVGEVEVDTLACTVMNAGNEVNLTRREYDVLVYLLRNPNRPVSKQELRERVWAGKDINLNTVEVYVKYLRNKLGEPEVIETRRGFGYLVRMLV